jgi:CheY-like chemotaxis protein
MASVVFATLGNCRRTNIVQGHVPVIAVTAHVRSEQVKVAFEAGMDDVVSKSFRVPGILEWMQKLTTGICSQ